MMAAGLYFSQTTVKLERGAGRRALAVIIGQSSTEAQNPLNLGPGRNIRVGFGMPS